MLRPKRCGAHCSTRFDLLERGFLPAVDQTFSDSAIDAEGQVQSIHAEPSDLDDLCHALGIETPKACTSLISSSAIIQFYVPVGSSIAAIS